MVKREVRRKRKDTETVAEIGGPAELHHGRRKGSSSVMRALNPSRQNDGSTPPSSFPRSRPSLRPVGPPPNRTSFWRR